MKRAEKSGFTLIELLVALAILGVIVVLCGRIFEQSNVSWNTGARKAEVNMVGRGIAHFIAQDISRCVVRDPADLMLTGQNPTFMILDEDGFADKTVALTTIAYDLDALTRSVNNGVAYTLAPKGMVKVALKLGPLDDNDIPGYVDVLLTVKDSDGASSVPFKSRAWLANRDRYRYDD